MLWSKLTVTAVMQITLGYFLGLALIPIFRRFKTGVFEPYIGDRFKTDNSEPAFGGAVMWVVFAFGAAVSAAFCDESAKLFAALIYTAVITSAGAADDFLTDVCGKPYSVKSGVKLGLCYAASLAFMLISYREGWTSSAVLLPFGLGFLDFKAAFCPVTAAAMTAVIYAFRALNRFGTDEKTSVGGLCYAVCFVTSLCFAVIGTAVQSEAFTAFGCVAAAAAASGAIWGLAPAKQRSGSSGGFFTGAVCAAAFALLPYYQTSIFISAGAATADALCAALQYIIYRKTKKLLLKGSSLHAHMQAKGMGEYAIISVFSLISLAAAVAAVALAIYGQNRYF